MTPMGIKDATRILAEGQPEYARLAIRDEKIEGVNFMVSQWKPTPKELDMLVCGGCIFLNIIGEVHPPVSLTVVYP